MSLFSRRAILFTAAATLATAGAASGALGVGDTAPDFTLQGTDGNDATLSSFRGQQNVVLAFFPKAFTGG